MTTDPRADPHPAADGSPRIIPWPWDTAHPSDEALAAHA